MSLDNSGIDKLRDPFGIYKRSKTARKIRDPLGFFEPPKAPVIPGVPTIDEAKKSQDEFDRVRRRRGVLANIFSSGASSSPTVGTKQLLGE